MVEGDFDLLSVKIARKVEEMRFEQLLGRIELRAHTKACRALQHLAARQYAARHGIDAVSRTQIGIDRQLGCGIAKIAPALVAMFHDPSNADGARKPPRRSTPAARPHPPPD